MSQVSQVSEEHCMKLHGVSMEDAGTEYDFELVEKLSAIIVAECEIPRECVTNIGWK